MAPPFAWDDTGFGGGGGGGAAFYQFAQIAGVDQPQRRAYNFPSPYWNIVDDAANNRTDVNPSGDFGALNLISTGNLLIGPTPRASTGVIRLGNNSAVIARNATDTADLQLMVLNAGNNLVLGASGIASTIIAASSGGILCQIAAVNRLTLTNIVLEITVPTVRIDSSVAAPVIQQEVITTATIVGQLLTFNAQDVSGNTSTTGGALLVRAGDATGTGGTHVGGKTTIRGGDSTGAAGTRTGGNLFLRPGTGASGNGNLALFSEAANYRNMQFGAFWGYTSNIPSSGETGGFFMFADNELNDADTRNLRVAGENNAYTDVAPCGGSIGGNTRRKFILNLCDEVTTSDGTTTTVLQFDPDDYDLDLVLTAEIEVIGQRTNSSSDYKRLVLPIRWVGSAADALSVGTAYGTSENAVGATWTVTADYSAPNIRVRVTGAAAQTVQWVARVMGVAVLRSITG